MIERITVNILRRNREIIFKKLGGTLGSNNEGIGKKMRKL